MMNVKTCKCGNTGWIETTEIREKIVPQPNENSETPKLVKIQEKIAVVIPCPHCSGKKDQLKNMLQIPKRFLPVTLENFEALNESLQLAKDECLFYADHFDMLKLNDQNSLLLVGPPGVGKTHLAVATLKRIVQQYNTSARFIDFRDVLSLIRKSYNEGKYGGDERIFDTFHRYELLVIDELGSEQMTDWVKEIVHRLIIPRYNHNLQTIFTTNYLDDLSVKMIPVDIEKEIKNSSSEHPETLDDRIGYRLSSKLREMCKIIHVFARDYRINFGEHAKPQNTSDLIAKLTQIQKEFSGLPIKSKEGFYQDAYKYNFSLALQSQEELAMWIYCQHKNKLSEQIPVRKFIQLMKELKKR